MARDMTKARLVTFALTFGVLASACKSVINQVAFQPDDVNVLPQSSLPEGIEEIFIATEDNVKIQGLYLPSAGSDKVLIYFHGNAGNVYHRIPSLVHLRSLGVNVVGAGYRGYGKSEGTPSEEGIYQDGDAVFKYVTEKLGFSESNIIILGRSIGTTVAINTAQGKEIGGLILVTPLTSGKAQAKAGGLGIASSLAGSSFDNLTKMGNVKAALLVVHGTDDRVIPYSMGEEIFDSAQTKKRLVRIEGAGHNNLQDTYMQAYWPPIFDFIKTNIGKTQHR